MLFFWETVGWELESAHEAASAIAECWQEDSIFVVLFYVES